MITKENDPDEFKWAQRLSRKGPFYLLCSEPIPLCTGEIGDRYTIIWNDKGSTKISYVEDGMCCRYGIRTMATLRGERPHDLWNGSIVSDYMFGQMLKVRHGESKLPTFDLFTLKDVRW